MALSHEPANPSVLAANLWTPASMQGRSPGSPSDSSSSTENSSAAFDARLRSLLLPLISELLDIAVHSFMRETSQDNWCASGKPHDASSPRGVLLSSDGSHNVGAATWLGRRQQSESKVDPTTNSWRRAYTLSGLPLDALTPIDAARSGMSGDSDGGTQGLDFGSAMGSAGREQESSMPSKPHAAPG